MAKDKWPLDGATVRLVRNPHAALPAVGQRPFHQPPTVNGGIKIGMETMVFVPGLEEQKAGFTPYQLVNGKAVDATRELLAHYSGIYKRVVNP